MRGVLPAAKGNMRCFRVVQCVRASGASSACDVCGFVGCVRCPGQPRSTHISKQCLPRTRVYAHIHTPTSQSSACHVHVSMHTHPCTHISKQCLSEIITFCTESNVWMQRSSTSMNILSVAWCPYCEGEHRQASGHEVCLEMRKDLPCMCVHLHASAHAPYALGNGHV